MKSPNDPFLRTYPRRYVTHICMHMDLVVCFLLSQQMECIDLESKFAEDRTLLLKLPEPFGTMSHCTHGLCVDRQVIA